MYLFNQLRDLYETSKPGTTEYVLSRYFLLNLNNIENITINDVVDKVAVSKSGISKFIKSISANQGFAAFKSSLYFEIQYSYISSKNYLKYYQELQKIVFCKEYFDLDKCKEFASEIKNSKRIIFCGHTGKKSMFDYLINYLLLHGKDAKFVCWIYYDYKRSDLEELSQDDLLIIVDPLIVK